MAMLQEAGIPIIRAEEHRLNVDPTTKERLNPTANDLRLTANNPDNNLVTAVYTGIVPIVYKAQRTLLTSLIDSIGLAFAMIAIVMMILLRDWRRRFSLRNSLNVTGGALSMLPNAFPVVMIFGLMGHLAVEVDIGSMMTASVALGVAVDDTIHFLSWFRLGMRQGLSRKESIRSAYAKVATAMTQTTLIAGLGLSAFALSTFTPTQRFGVLMLTLLFAALIGDLIFLPALLASPFGRFLGVKPLPKPSGSPGEKSLDEPPSVDVSASESTSAGRLPGAGKVHFRKDRAHDAENSLKHPD
jgi:predicted RND superfamily exporter protein